MNSAFRGAAFAMISARLRDIEQGAGELARRRSSHPPDLSNEDEDDDDRDASLPPEPGVIALPHRQ